MNARYQTIAALVIVALSVIGLAWRAWARRGHPGCEGGGCGAVSADARALRRKLKRP